MTKKPSNFINDVSRDIKLNLNSQHALNIPSNPNPSFNSNNDVIMSATNQLQDINYGKKIKALSQLFAADKRMSLAKLSRYILS